MCKCISAWICVCVCVYMFVSFLLIGRCTLLQCVCVCDSTFGMGQAVMSKSVSHSLGTSLPSRHDRETGHRGE